MSHYNGYTIQQIAPIMLSCIAFGAWGFALGYYLGAILGCMIGGGISYTIIEIFVMRPRRKNIETDGNLKRKLPESLEDAYRRLNLDLIDAKDQIKTLTAQLDDSYARSRSIADRVGLQITALREVRAERDALAERVEKLRRASNTLVRAMGQADRKLDLLSTGNLPHQRGVVSCAIRYPLREFKAVLLDVPIERIELNPDKPLRQVLAKPAPLHEGNNGV